MKKVITCSLLFIALSIQLDRPVLASNPTPSESILNLDQYEGKVVYLDFWASWCVPCRKSFPWMNKLQDKYSDNELVIIAVNLDKKRSLADEFLAENPAKFKIVYDPKGKLAKKFKIKGMPSSVIFDQKGKPIIAHTGFFVKQIHAYEQEIKNTINGD